MIWMLAGMLAVVLLSWGAKSFAKADPKQVISLARKSGGVALLAVAALLLLRGRIDMAIMVGSAGGFLLGIGPWAVPNWAKRTRTTPGSASRVRSAMFEMELDHDTGAMAGQVLAGRFAGRPLASLAREDFAALAAECRGDPDSLRLLEAYMDGRFPGWRQDGQGYADPAARGTPLSGPMTEEEAYQVLGLAPGAGVEEIRDAHRRLMKRLHPDQGGSNFLAAKINEAKEVLLKGHR